VADIEMNLINTKRKILVTVKTDENGNFNVPPQDLPVGLYTVYFGQTELDIPKKYQNPTESQIKLGIKSGTNNFTIQLE
jgi:hypothetical protein